MTAVLIAGIGNVFLGDDGFGVAVAHRIQAHLLPEGVRCADYGIRGVHLAYDLLDRPADTLILIDAVPMDEPPGTVAVLEADHGADQIASQGDEGAQVDAHAMNPEAVLAALRALGGEVGRVLVVGCQPHTLAPGMELSPAVAAAVPVAVQLTIDVAAQEVAVHA